MRKVIIHISWRFLTGHGINLAMLGAGSWVFFFRPAGGSNPLDYVFESRAAGWILLLAWGCQVAGAWLKRFPLQKRLESIKVKLPVKEEDDEDEPSSLHPLIKRKESQIFFFMMMHPVISGMVFGFAFSNLFPVLRGGVDDSHWWTIPWVILLLIGAVLPTVFVAKAMFPVKNKLRFAWMERPYIEYIADQLLFISFIILFSSIFSMPAMMQGIKPINPSGLIEWTLTIVFLVPLLWLGLMLFFVPYRILLMIEDMGTWRSRLSSLVAVLPVIIKYIKG